MNTKSILTISTFALTSLTTQNLFAEGFNDDQKKEIQEIAKSYLLENPEILQQMVEQLQAKEEKESADKAKVAISENSKELFAVTQTTPTAGNDKGEVRLVVFQDPYCGFCRKFHATLVEAQEKQKNLQIIFRDIAVLGDESKKVIRAAIAAHKQGKYAEYYDIVFKAEGVLDDEQLLDIAKKVSLDIDQWNKDREAAETQAQFDTNTQLSKAVAVSGTPTFIIGSDKFEGVMVPGAISYAALEKLIAEAQGNADAEGSADAEDNKES